MPLALFAAMPPIMAELMEAGSGPIFLPKGASQAFARAPTTPGWSEIVDASGEIE